MNDRKFLGLLNLYLDDEIDRDSATVLEREIHTNLRRRQMYGEYCRIHRATKLVYERFRTAATEQGAAGIHALRQDPLSADGVAEADATAAQTGRGLVRTTVYWLGGVAAACAAAYAVFLYAPRTTTPEATTSNVEAPLALATPPAQQEKVTTTPESPAPPVASTAPIAAPFAAEFRLDPFLADRPFERRSPFSFSSQPASGSFVGFEPRPISAFYLRNPTDSAQTSFRGLNLQPTKKDSADSRIFRHTTDGGRETLEPVGYQIQR